MKYLLIASVVLLSLLSSCAKYLDVVPDNVATIDNAFKMRANAEQYLFTCYSYMPSSASISENPALYGSDEMWHYDDTYAGIRIAKGNQGIVSPLMNYWSGSDASGTTSLWRGIRDCNIFLENISRVRDMNKYEKDRWIAEVKVLKAYYHYYLMRMYGPIPLVRQNLPISADVNEVQVFREPVDECVGYIVELLDEAAAEDALPVSIQDVTTELGRISKSIALALKAEVLVTAASPLYNGNPDYANFANKDGKKLFSLAYDASKWERAAKACKEAIDFCHNASYKLYTYNLSSNPQNISPETYTKMSVRGSVTARGNPEMIWPDSRSSTGTLQREAQARLDAGIANASVVGKGMSPTLKMAELFYTKNGVPIDEDNSWDYAGRYGLKTAGEAEKNLMQTNYQTATLHFDREARFYGSLAFDGSAWYGQGKFTESSMWYVNARLGQYAGGPPGGNRYSITGYWPQKLVNPASTYSATVAFVSVEYPWPIIRLADLYLLYAEALNEWSGPGEEVYHYLNLIRERAGLNTVQYSWENSSKTANKYQNKDGLREIIHQERTIELAFEGHRFWDLRRWKKAVEEMNKPVYGWDVGQSEASLYYTPKVIFNQVFKTRDYFWPIKESDMLVNRNLVQNPGW
ncbi:RagB/SusD family nutrient uptake outer membrane protein [Pedobacter ginsengisoli]|uniref:RagB/SusD family nutrient uptake outer membrane protein n=1 Tax=Pedobacter ginsengisoli TaxID=363852 RepID=UPI00254F5B01|nr:RagB/SusD family nutrient uptake outer membrane protein [Pedobacter ginsengisoli]